MGERPLKQRRYAPKVRSGCVTCKIRRVKCDGMILHFFKVVGLRFFLVDESDRFLESKPLCDRCTSTGRKCDGYATVPKTTTEQVNWQEPLTAALSSRNPSNALERRTFEFFRFQTTPCISGYFADSLWDKTVLQVCQSEPTVRHAINALSGLHEERVLRQTFIDSRDDSSLVRTSFPIKEYAKALNGLQKLLNSTEAPLNVILITCLLCIHFEALRENFVPTLIHVENAIRLLHVTGKDNTKKVDQSLIRAFMRIDLQASLYIGVRTPSLPFYTSDTDTDLPSSFKSLTHARDYLNTWTCRLYHFCRGQADHYMYHEPGNVPLELYAQAQDLESRFQSIDHLVWLFMQNPSTRLSFREHHGLGFLRCLAKLNRVIAATALYAEASSYDRFLDTFEEVLAICRAVLDSENAERRLFSVSLDEGLLNPLNFVACNCRDSRTRRSALTLLKTMPAREGVWHVEVMTRSAEAAIEYEEALCTMPNPRCEDVPEWRRVHMSGAAREELAGTTRKTVTVHCRVRPNGLDGEWYDFEVPVEM